MLTSFHIRALISELKDEIIGGKIVTTEFYKKERTALFFIKNKSRTVLAFCYHPTRFGVYHAPASKIKMTTREKPWPIFSLDKAEIISVEQLGFDRIFKINISQDNKKNSLLFEAIGVNGNIFLLDENEIKIATLRKREIKKSEKYQHTPVEGKLNPLELDYKSLAKLSENCPDNTIVYFIEKNILGCTFTLAREIVKRSSLENKKVSEITKTEWEKVLVIFSQIISFYENPQAGYLYQVGNKFELFPFKLSIAESQPEKFKTLSLGMAALMEKKQDVIEQVDEQKFIFAALKKAAKRLQKRLKNIEKDLHDAVNYENYKIYGELLQINFDKIKKGYESITVANVYSDGQESMIIKLDSSLSPVENTELYFKKFRKGREGLALMERRKEITEQELLQLSEITADFEADFDNAVNRYQAELSSLLPKEGVKQVAFERLPYKEYLLKTGLKIYVGRDGADNDRTTFDYAKPYELWFHTQQCAGSHVVIKYPSKKFEPAKQEIEETAAVAAYFSKAKNDSLVPVVYTQRKYVRKPRKAKPGLVSVEREKSVMVEPKKPENS